MQEKGELHAGFGLGKGECKTLAALDTDCENIDL